MFVTGATGPELDPIEHAFVKRKTLLRTAAGRTVEALWHTIASSWAPSASPKCARYLAHAG